MIDEKHRGRQVAIRAVFLLGAALLIGKVFHLQIVSDSFRAEANAVGNLRTTQYPSRGLMLDRNGKLLTVNQAAYDLYCTYRTFAEHAATFDTAKFCRLLRISPDYFAAAIEKDWNDIRFSKLKPFVFLSNLPQARFATFQEVMHEFPGFSARPRSLRAYPYAVGGHLVGYMGEVDQRRIDREPDFYRRGDYVGVSGIEYKYENTLRGEKGNRWIAVDRLGREVGETVAGKLDEPATAGADLLTTIDIDLQAYGEKLMRGKIGSIVAIEPATGEILCMVSSPTYDLRDMAIGRGRGRVFNRLSRDTLQPLLNRAINGKYPPGSPFKTVVALIAMQNGTLHPDRGIPCRGAFYSNGMRLTGCHAHPYCKDVKTAIAHSCNNYFITAWLENVNRFGAISPDRGFDDFNKYLYQFGLGVKTGIDYPGEIRGNVPTSEFYTERFADDEFWRAIWVRSLAIGQGEYEITNLQMANLAAAIGNRGFWLTPHLVRGLKLENDSITAPPHPIYQHEIDIESRYFDVVANGMRQTFQYGTARTSEVAGLDICGKTGTAENKGADHSILFAFAPQENPKIAISVYIENGGFGSTYAAPIASLMIEKYLRDEIEPGRQWLEDRMFAADLIARQAAR